ncbi:MAG: porin [Acidobacteriota bacterium]
MPRGFPFRPPTLFAFIIVIFSFVQPGSAQDAPSFQLGGRAQVWYEALQHAAPDHTTGQDFLIRRAYITLNGKLPGNVSLVAQIGGDRIGQQGLDNPGLAVGSGVAFRDLFIAWEPTPAVRLQLGRMCIPFVRAFGSESAFGLLALDVPFSQGGTRGALFYASKVGRDDGIVLWGTPLDGHLQYRLGVMEGVEGSSNPSDSLRYAGRFIVNVFDPETTYATRGTYLGTKRVLALAAGFDRQSDLATSTVAAYDPQAWTTDVFFDQPVRGGAVTVEASFSDVNGLTQPMAFAGLTPGADARIGYMLGGYLLPQPIGKARLQVYGRYESIDGPDDSDTTVPAFGANVLLRGQDFKTSAEWSRIDHTGSDPVQIFTVQMQIAF